jgi:hypothetical protein
LKEGEETPHATPPPPRAGAGGYAPDPISDFKKKEKNPESDFSVFRFFFDCLDRSRQRSARWQVISRLREKGLSKGVLKK